MGLSPLTWLEQHPLKASWVLLPPRHKRLLLSCLCLHGLGVNQHPLQSRILLTRSTFIKINKLQFAWYNVGVHNPGFSSRRGAGHSREVHTTKRLKRTLSGGGRAQFKIGGKWVYFPLKSEIFSDHPLINNQLGCSFFTATIISTYLHRGKYKGGRV